MEEILRSAAILGMVSVLFMLAAVIDPAFTGMTAFHSEGDSSLTIWDETDTEGGEEDKYTYPTNSLAYSGCNDFKKSNPSYWNVYFFGNYSNSTSDPIDNLTGNCEIRLNKTGTWTSWTNMSYNQSSDLWQYNTSFTYKGKRGWEVNCTSASYSDIYLEDSNGVEITTSQPCIFGRQTIGGPLKNLSCSEEITCHYYLNLNSTDDDANDPLTYDHASIGWDESYMELDSSGHFTVLITKNSDPSSFNVTFIVTDTDSSSDVAYMLINENYTNDAPVFDQLPDETEEDSEFEDFVITATDEESNTPFKFNVTFLGCQKAHWVADPTENCSIFNFTLSDTNITLHNFTPSNWDVGTYHVNFTVEDNGTDQFDYNSTHSQDVWFNVTNVNDGPVITPVNATEIELSQNERLYITFNGTDIENDTLLFNSTTLLWNESNLSYYAYSNASLFPVSTNGTYYPNESAYGIIDFVLTNGHVGNYTLNITLTDNGTGPPGENTNLTDSLLMNLTVLNLNDPPVLENLTDVLPGAVQELPYYYGFDASDPDMLTPYGDNLTFGFSFHFCETPNGTECDIHQNSTFTVMKTGNTTAKLYVYAIRNDSGNYTLNLTVTDEGGLLNWSLVNLSIQPDEAPVINAAANLSGTQNQALFYYFDITDPEDHMLNITNVTLYRNNLSAFPFNLFPVKLNSSTYPPAYNLTMNYTNLTNAQVGNWTLEINATDIWNRTTRHLLNISVANINDPPRIINWTNCYDDKTYQLNDTFEENIDYCIMLNDPDPDLLVPPDTYVENITYTMYDLGCTTTEDYVPSGNCSGTPVIDVDYDSGHIAFTAANETWHGNYTYNISIHDRQYVYASKVFTMEIVAVNDPPVLHNINESYNITAELKFNFTVNATDEEGNYPLFYDVDFTWCDSPPCDLFPVDNETGEVNFTGTNDDIGNYTANFSVTDAGNLTLDFPNATGWEMSNISVFRRYHAPTIQHLYPTKPEPDQNMTEGTVKTFRYEANDTTDNDTLTCYWYFNDGTNITFITPDTTLPDHEQLENPVYNCNTTPGGSLGTWLYPVTYDDALNLSQRPATIILSVVDPQGFVVNKSVDPWMTVVGANRKPRFYGPMQSEIVMFAGTEVTPFSLDDYFFDDWGEVLNYSYIGASHLDDVIINDDSSVTFVASERWFGTDMIQFVANDSQLTNTSNIITLKVEYRPPHVVDRPVNVRVPKVASMEILVDEIIPAQAMNTSRARVVIHNDGDFNLRSVNISTRTNVTNITLSLYDGYVDEIGIGQNFTTWLNITVGDLEEGTYLAHIFANSTNPRIQESATLNIKVIPSNATKVIIEIVMVKDLFEENPECMELYGLIVEAEDALGENDIERARELTQMAMDHCQDMIDYAELQKGEGTAPSIVGQIIVNPFFVMGFVLAILALAMGGYWYMSKRAVKSEPKKLDTGEEEL
jgi:hypothetical protein